MGRCGHTAEGMGESALGAEKSFGEHTQEAAVGKQRTLF